MGHAEGIGGLLFAVAFVDPMNERGRVFSDRAWFEAAVFLMGSLVAFQVFEQLSQVGADAGLSDDVSQESVGIVEELLSEGSEEMIVAHQVRYTALT